MTTSGIIPSWQDISWNGISFQVPASWQPVVILDNYLLFEDQYRPILELKWQQIKGSFSIERILKQLRRSGSKKDSIKTRSVPQQWQQLLKPFNCYTFEWQGEKNYGTGLLRHCPNCNLTILLQFYMDDPQDEPVCLHILQTLRCHQETDYLGWSIYDIAFSLPVDANLQAQEFHTGRYRISFQFGELFFSLLRFKPAEALLSDIGLTGFGQQLLQHGEQYIDRDEDLQHACWRKEGNSWLRFKKKLRRQQADHFLCLRHFPEHNVILGVQAKSNQPIDEKVVQTLLQNYWAN
jgi:hypothetical protein